MNPCLFGKAALALLEGIGHATNPKKQKETKREERRFLFWYGLLMLFGVRVIGWTIYSLYFAG